MAPYLFYRSHIKTKKLIPPSEFFPRFTGKKIAHPHVVRQEGTHGPDDGGREAEGNSTSSTLTKGMAEAFNALLSR
jgi:hypothetical protein